MSLGGATGGGPRVIVIARDFSKFPGGRYRDDGPNSGEEFREQHLVPALRAARELGEKVVVEFDGATGYAASFLEEAFGGLVREDDFAPKELSRLMELRAGPLFDSYRLLVERYIREARPRAIA